jgi:hypothetical protein
MLTQGKGRRPFPMEQRFFPADVVELKRHPAQEGRCASYRRMRIVVEPGVTQAIS